MNSQTDSLFHLTGNSGSQVLAFLTNVKTSEFLKDVKFTLVYNKVTTSLLAEKAAGVGSTGWVVVGTGWGVVGTGGIVVGTGGTGFTP